MTWVAYSIPSIYKSLGRFLSTISSIHIHMTNCCMPNIYSVNFCLSSRHIKQMLKEHVSLTCLQMWIISSTSRQCMISGKSLLNTTLSYIARGYFRDSNSWPPSHMAAILLLCQNSLFVLHLFDILRNFMSFRPKEHNIQHMLHLVL